MALAVDVQGLEKRYVRPERTITVLAGVSFSVEEGSWLVLTGASGCGKTTLLHLLGILDRPDAGEIRYFGQMAWALNPLKRARLRRMQIGFIFQSYQLFPELNALENIMLPGRLQGLRLGSCRDRATALLERLGMLDRMEHRPAELSGGEQQRIAIARSLINDPRVILADEPTGNLDPKNAEAIMQILRRLRDEDGKAVIMVTHDRSLTRYADKVMVLAEGHLRPLNDQ